MPKTNFKALFEAKKSDYEKAGYQMIHRFLFNPLTSIFSNDKTRPCYVKITWCNSCETCQAYKEGKCVKINNIGFSSQCPFSKTYYQEGMTKRSKSFLSFINDAREVFDIDGEPLKPLYRLENTSYIGDGNFIFLYLNHLNNYVNSIDTELGIIDHNFIPVKNFTPETVKKLLDFRPQALMGGVIKTYKDNDLSYFVRDLRFRFPELYKECVQGTEYEGFEHRINFVGKKAYLRTLHPGKVKFNFKVWEWNGEKLTIRGKDFDSTLVDDELIELTPKDGTIVEILDNNTVNEYKTRFREM